MFLKLQSMKTKFIFLFILSILTFSTLNAGVKLHMVMFCNSTDKSVGQAMLVDASYYDYLSSELKLALAEDVEVVYHRFLGGNCCPAKVKEYINNLSCKGDIVFFVYTGHGGRSHNDTSKFPRMCLGSNYANEWIKVSDIVEVLKNKGARLQVVIADCCNSYYDRPMKQNREGFTNKTNTISPTVLRRLFYETEGSVCITAASPGEYGWCNSRYVSFLSYYLITTLQNNKEEMTWQMFFDNVSNKVYEHTDRMYRNRYITNSQRPVFDVFVKPKKVNDGNPGGNDDGSGNDDGNPGGGDDGSGNDDGNPGDSDDGSGNDDGNPGGGDGGSGNDDGNSGGGDGGYVNDNNRDEYSDDNNTNPSVALFSFLILGGLGYILFAKISLVFKYSSFFSFVVKIIGIGFIIKSFLILFEIIK